MSAVRRAVHADAGEIAGVDVRAWWHGYRDFLDEQRLLERTVDQRLTAWQEHLGAASETETWVLVVAGRIAGYVSVGPSHDPDAAPRCGEIAALYVDPPAQGAGVGTTLLGHAQARLRELEHGTATLWTFEANGLARAFYERHDWRLDPSGSGNEGCEWWGPAVRYARALG